MKPLTHSMVLSLACGLSVLGLVGRAEAATLELVFFIDGSLSITDADYELQLNAYRSVFNNETFYRQVVQPAGNIAVSVLQFAGEIRQEVNWSMINSFQDAQAFGNLFTLDEMPKLNQSFSRLGTAIQCATGGPTSGNSSECGSILGVFDNTIQGDRLILDIGTDGYFFEGDHPVTAANNARAYAEQNNLNFVINAISPTQNYGPFLPQIIGGTNNNGNPAFIEVADSIAVYERTLCGKIKREINPNAPGDPCSVTPQSVPESNSLFGLLTMAILGLGSQCKKLLKNF